MKLIPGAVRCMVLLILCYSSIVLAEEKQSIDCTVKPYEGELFQSLYQSAADTSKIFCNQLIRSRLGQNDVDSRFIGSILEDFAAGSRKHLDDLNLSLSANYQAQFNQLRMDFRRFDFHDIKMPEFKVRRSIGTGAQGYFEPLDQQVGRFDIKEVDHCKTISPGVSCKAVFEDYASAFNPYRSAYDNVYDNQLLLTELGARWDAFLQVSKSQTVWEVYLTTLAHRKHFQKDHLVGPPDYQVIALHPRLIYNSMDKAPDGSNQEIGLAVEWIGANFWDLKLGSVRMPLGASFTSVYVDRPEVRDVGHGIMLHIYNHYSIGWADHDSNDSFYISVDLLKMFEDKKAQYDQFLKHVM